MSKEKMSKADIERTMEQCMDWMQRDIELQAQRARLRFDAALRSCKYTDEDIHEHDRAEALVRGMRSLVYFWKEYKEACNDADDKIGNRKDH